MAPLHLRLLVADPARDDVQELLRSLRDSGHVVSLTEGDGVAADFTVIDAVARLLPGTLGDAESAVQESFSDGLLDWPHYTRPEVWAGCTVPEVLASGNHAAIARWRLKQALGRTWQRRPDLLAGRNLSDVERKLLAEYQAEQDATRREQGQN